MTTPRIDCGRRNSRLAVAATVLALGGIVTIGVAIDVPQRAPQPAPSAFGSLESDSPSHGSHITAPATLPGPKASTPVTPEATVPVLQDSPPVSIEIPAIGLRSDLQYLGLTAQHTLQVPSGRLYDQPAWYNGSSPPGSPGPAVILAHVDSAARGPSAFYNLGKVQPGDEVLITRNDGLVAVFIVEAVRSYPKTVFPTELVYGPTDRSVLRLITCGGTFDHTTRHYLNNIIVFASLTDLYDPAQGPLAPA